MTLRESLLAISPYPIPSEFIDSVGVAIGGVDMDSEVGDLEPVSIYRAKARVYYFLATTPNVSEGGVSISFTAEDKRIFLAMARRFASLAGEGSLIPGAVYGYKGENL